MSREWSDCSASCGKDGLRHQLYDCESVESKITEYSSLLILSVGEPSWATGVQTLRKITNAKGFNRNKQYDRLEKTTTCILFLPDELGPLEKNSGAASVKALSNVYVQTKFTCKCSKKFAQYRSYFTNCAKIWILKLII